MKAVARTTILPLLVASFIMPATPSMAYSPEAEQAMLEDCQVKFDQAMALVPPLPPSTPDNPIPVEVVEARNEKIAAIEAERALCLKRGYNGLRLADAIDAMIHASTPEQLTNVRNTVMDRCKAVADGWIGAYSCMEKAFKNAALARDALMELEGLPASAATNEIALILQDCLKRKKVEVSHRNCRFKVGHEKKDCEEDNVKRDHKFVSQCLLAGSVQVDQWAQNGRPSNTAPIYADGGDYTGGSSSSGGSSDPTGAVVIGGGIVAGGAIVDALDGLYKGISKAQQTLLGKYRQGDPFAFCYEGGNPITTGISYLNPSSGSFAIMCWTPIGIPCNDWYATVAYMSLCPMGSGGSPKNVGPWLGAGGPGVPGVYQSSGGSKFKGSSVSPSGYVPSPH